jgi:hypothetical protein
VPASGGVWLRGPLHVPLRSACCWPGRGCFVRCVIIVCLPMSQMPRAPPLRAAAASTGAALLLAPPRQRRHAHAASYGRAAALPRFCVTSTWSSPNSECGGQASHPVYSYSASTPDNGAAPASATNMSSRRRGGTTHGRPPGCSPGCGLLGCAPTAGERRGRRRAALLRGRPVTAACLPAYLRRPPCTWPRCCCCCLTQAVFSPSLRARSTSGWQCSHG